MSSLDVRDPAQAWPPGVRDPLAGSRGAISPGPSSPGRWPTAIQVTALGTGTEALRLARERPYGLIGTAAPGDRQRARQPRGAHARGQHRHPHCNRGTGRMSPWRSATTAPASRRISFPASSTASTGPGSGPGDPVPAWDWPSRLQSPPRTTAAWPHWASRTGCGSRSSCPRAVRMPPGPRMTLIGRPVRRLRRRPHLPGRAGSPELTRTFPRTGT